MTRVKSISDIGQVYNQMLESKIANQTNTQEIVEEKVVKKLESFPKATDKKINLTKIMAKGSDKNAFAHKDSGPEAALGVSKKIVDPKTSKKNNYFEPEKFSDNTRKLAKENINNHMKSIFDKLYEDVIGSDKLDIGLQAGPEGEATDAKDLDLSGGSEDTVTVKLDRDLAQKLHDALMDVLGGGEEEHGGEDLGDEAAPLEDKEEAEEKKEDKKDEAEEAEEKKEEKKEDKKEVAGEGTDLKEVSPKAGQGLVGHGTTSAGRVPTVGTAPKAKGGKAVGTVSCEVDGKGKTVPPAGGHSLTKPSSWNVNATGYKVGDFFK